jgi:hypothetical protein
VQFSTAALACGFFVAGLAHAEVEGAKLYAGPEGMKVTVIRLSGDPGLLLSVQGSDSSYDGKALPATQEEDGERTRYCTQHAGREVCPFHVVNRYGTRSYVFYPGWNRQEISLQWDEKGSAALDAGPVVKRYEAQQKDGTLAKFMDFDRPGEQAQAAAAVAEQVKETAGKCGGVTFPLEVKWTSISDDVLKRFSVASYCGAPLEALSDLCEFPSVRALLTADVKSVECTFGAQVAFSLEKGVLRWTTSTEGSNLKDAARKGFEEAFGGTAPVAAGAPGWGNGKTLRELQALDGTSVCTDGQGYVAVMAPGERGERLYAGSSRSLVEVQAQAWGVPGGMFLEPRYPNPTANPNFRGSDMRVYSELEVDRAKQACVLRCGTRTLPLQLLAPARAKEVLLAAKVEPNPQQYGPHALLRDDKGRYYFIDKGLRKDNGRSYRVFLGNKGKLEPQKLVNLVADTEGEVFSTKSGELRLVVDRQDGSTWIQSGKKLQLRAVPVNENLPLIYNELGVYQGVRLGTPCDDAPL